MIRYGILDNDPKGKSGRGTVFWMEVIVDDQIKRYEWGLLEELRGEFSPEAAMKPARDEAARQATAAAEFKAAEKQAAQEERVAAIKSSPVLDEIIEFVVTSEPKSVAEFKSGKDKALNALVGKVIGQIKAKKLTAENTADAFAINQLLRQKLA